MLAQFFFSFRCKHYVSASAMMGGMQLSSSFVQAATDNNRKEIDSTMISFHVTEPLLTSKELYMNALWIDMLCQKTGASYPW